MNASDPNGPASGLYCGAVVHTRVRPKRHRLRYRLFMMCLDLDELPDLDRTCRLFSHNGFNLFGFYDRDHGDGSDRPLRDQIADRLREAAPVAGWDGEIGRIRLVCLPRMLGYVFNPISIYYCEDREGVLRFMLYEVNNTFGERHSYLIAVKDPSDPIRQSCAKRLHVSPFMDMDMTYDFRITKPGRDVNVAIVGRDRTGPLIVAGFAGRLRALTDRALLRSFVAYPLLTLGVVAGIHWEALKLFAKGIGVRTHRPAPAHSFTFVSPPTSEAL